MDNSIIIFFRYKRAEGPNVTADECILPDDDDIHIISDPTPPPPRRAAPATVSLRGPALLKRRRSKRMPVNTVKADQAYSMPFVPIAPAPHITPVVSPPTSVPLSTPTQYATLPTPTPPQPSTPNLVVHSEEILSDLNTPISLDSDDEDTIVPHHASSQGPIYLVPASSAPLTAAAPSCFTVSQGALPTASTRPVVPVSLTQVGAPASTRQFQNVNKPIMISKGNVPVYNSVTGSQPISVNPQQSQSGNTNYILIPAGSFNQTSPGMQTLTPVQLAGQGASQLTRITQEAVPVSLHNAVMAQKSQPAPATPQSQPTPETPKPQAPPVVTKPQVQPSTKNIKRLCKPGDILRITEGGKIEVLKRKDIPEDTPTTASINNTSVSGSTSKKTSAIGRRGVTSTTSATPSKQEPNKNKNTISRKGLTSSNSDNDPLSILRDVIHIEADDYDSEVSNTKTPSKQAPAKPSTSAPPTKTLAGTKSGRTSASNSQEKWHSVLTHRSAKANTNVPSDKTAISNTRKADETLRETKQPASDQNKNKERILGSVDLTHLDVTSNEPVSSTSGTSASKKPKGLKGATTIVGTSKSIILCGSGKAVATGN